MILFSRYRQLLLILLFAFLYGCTATTNKTSQTNVNQWQFSGKIAVTYPKPRCDTVPCPKSSSQGKIDWLQQQSNYLISLYDPFSRKLMDIRGDDAQLIVISPNQAPIYAQAADFLSLLGNSDSIKQAFDGLTPDDFRYWATGRPNPNLQLERLGDDDTAFKQKKFLIKSKQWRSTSLGQMPFLITILKRPYQIRLVVKEWIKP